MAHLETPCTFSIPTKCFLSFLPCTEIYYVFAELLSITPVGQTIFQFTDYILETYVDFRIFSPEIWAETPDKGIVRTTNTAESYHRHLKDQFYVSHCSVHVVIDDLLK